MASCGKAKEEFFDPRRSLKTVDFCPSTEAVVMVAGVSGVVVGYRLRVRAFDARRGAGDDLCPFSCLHLSL